MIKPAKQYPKVENIHIPPIHSPYVKAMIQRNIITA